MKTPKRNKLDVAISIANCDVIIAKSSSEKEKLWASLFKFRFEKERNELDKQDK